MTSPVLELVLRTAPEGDAVGLMCPKCRRGFYAPQHKKLAELCCVDECKQCGAKTEKFWIVCQACRAANDAAKTRELYEAATKVAVADYDFGYVSLTDYNDYMPVDEVEEPWAFACVPQPWSSLRAEDIIEQLCDEMHEVASEGLDGASLQEVLDKWIEAQGESNCFITDTSRVVVFHDGCADPDEETGQ